MNKQDNYCVIMAGGVGSRFWPLSRNSRPKQFIDVFGSGETLIQQTFKRFERLCPKQNIYIVTNTIYKNMVLEQLPNIAEEQVLCEPMRRNTAPCVAFANIKIQEKNPNANIIVAPSDHIILKEDVFVNVLQGALDCVAQHDCLLTLGIEPSRPDTGYGYIQYADEDLCENNNDIKRVKTFTEKPKLELAERFLQSGDFLWNAGIFVWSLKSIQQAFQKHLPNVLECFTDDKKVMGTRQEDMFIEQAYSVCPNISLDYGIMEKADNVYVLRSEFGWSDLGTWASLYDVREKNKEGNVLQGRHIKTYNTTNSIVNVKNKNKLVVLQGVDNMIVVDDEDVLLICNKEQEQNVRDIVLDVKVEKGTKYI